MTASAHATNGSSTLTYTWASAPESCGSAPDEFAFDHYLVCRVAGTSIGSRLTDPDDADACTAIAVPYSSTGTEDLVHQSSQGFTVTLFACEDATCSTWYDQTLIASHEDDDDLAFGSTEMETWELVGVSGYSDSDRVVDDPTTSGEPLMMAAGALFYPSGFTHADKLGMWWSDDEANIWFRRADDTGNQDWNTYTGWAAAAELVAETQTASSDYAWATHPWVVAADRAGSRFIRMFLQTEDDGTYTPTNNHIFSVDSTDDEGSDFDLECTDTGDCTNCAYEALCDYDSVATMEICAGGGTGCTEMVDARHGKVMWDYIANGAVDFVLDDPMMVFTGDRDAACTPDWLPSDLFMAEWDKGSAVWGIDMSSGCAVRHVDKQHDPGVIPLPGGAYKMYAHTTTGEIHVFYRDPTTGAWGDGKKIEVVFDGTSTDASACLENVETVVRKGSGPADEIMFLRATPTTLLGPSCFDDGGIIYAEHVN